MKHLNSILRGVFALGLLSGCAMKSTSSGLDSVSRPLVIAHRGASGELPEHTLEAYRRAIQQGADFIEPDLVCTKDGVLIARHENEIGETTDVAKKFPRRKTKKTIDGQLMEGWFAEDFTWAEIRQLRAVQRVSTRDQSFNGLYAIPSFREVLKLRADMSAEHGREIGVYPETKHPHYHRSIGCKMEGTLLKDLSDFNLNRKSAPVFVQSFEVSNLREIRQQSDVRLVQLIGDPFSEPADKKGTGETFGRLLTREGMQELAKHVEGIGPYKQLIVLGPADESGNPSAPIKATAEALQALFKLREKKGIIITDFVERAHTAGLQVHPWTLRSDAPFLPSFWEGNAEKEFLFFAELGVDGIFTDNTAEAIKAYKPLVPKK